MIVFLLKQITSHVCRTSWKTNFFKENKTKKESPAYLYLNAKGMYLNNLI